MNTYNVSVNHLCEVKGEQDGEADKLRKSEPRLQLTYEIRLPMFGAASKAIPRKAQAKTQQRPLPRCSRIKSRSY